MCKRFLFPLEKNTETKAWCWSQGDKEVKVRILHRPPQNQRRSKILLLFLINLLKKLEQIIKCYYENKVC